MGRTSTKDEERCGRPQSSDHDERVAKIKGMLDERRAWTISLMSCRLAIPSTSLFRILTDELKMKKKLGKWIPHELTEEQKELRIVASKLNKERFQKNPNTLRRTLAIDE